jgi:hypothetical protein
MKKQIYPQNPGHIHQISEITYIIETSHITLMNALSPHDDADSLAKHPYGRTAMCTCPHTVHVMNILAMNAPFKTDKNE